MTQFDIQDSLMKLTLHDPIRRVVWNSETKRSISAALNEVLGDEESSTVCKSVDTYIIGTLFKKLASHLSKTPTSSTAVAISPDVMQCLTSVAFYEHSAEILQRALVHCALRYLLASDDPAKAYNQANEMLQCIKRYDEPARVTELRHSADHLLNKCTTLGIQNGRKFMVDEAAKFESLCPIANVLKDLNRPQHALLQSSHFNNQSSLRNEKKKNHQKQQQQQQQSQVTRIRTRLDYDNRVSVWMHDAPDSETPTVELARQRPTSAAASAAVVVEANSESPAPVPAPSRESVHVPYPRAATEPVRPNESAIGARVSSWNTGSGRPQRRFTGLSTPSMPSWVGRSASRPGAAARMRYRRNLVRKFFSRSSSTPHNHTRTRTRARMGIRSTSRITRCFK